MDKRTDEERREAEAADETFVAWFTRDTGWSRAGLPLAIVLLLLGPIVRRGVGRPAFLVYLQLPVYMIHQYEEHGHGAFKRYANRLLPPGKRGVTDRKIFWINIAGVWGIDLCALYLARYVALAFGLVAPYLAIVNGILHLGGALRERRYNPGLWTGLLLFLPVGGYSIRALSRAAHASKGDHARGLGAAILIHAVVMFSLMRVARD